MSGRVTSCPNCGGQVEFKAAASLLTVCPYCSTAISRVGDDVTELEIRGVVAPLVATASPLQLGVWGSHKGKRFQLIGRLQLDHGSGPWDEWYARFEDGRWGWVAEAQGQVYLTFPFPFPSAEPPDYSNCQVGRRYQFGPQNFIVVERRVGRFVSAQGDLPFVATPGSEFRFADLEGDRGGFATFDFGTNSIADELFLGDRLTYADLFGEDVLSDWKPPEVIAVSHNCPKCGAGIEIKAPGESETISCSACESVLDCSKGNQLFLLKAAKRKTPKPLLPMDKDVRFRGKKHTPFGYLLRSVVVEGVTYSWEEYLLRGEDRAYRWLVCSDGHWLWVESAARGEVKTEHRKATYRNKVFKHFQTASARVDGIHGEFYWKVRIGDIVSSSDYVAPPEMLSCEKTQAEVSWSLGTYVEPDEVKQAFRIKKLPDPVGVAPASPNPYALHRASLLKLAGILTLIYVLFGFLVAARSDGRTVYEHSDQIVNASPSETVPVLSEPFEIQKRSNFELEARAAVDNSWAFVAGDLVNTDTGEVRSFEMEVAYYHGYSGGESWSEGGRSRTIHMSGIEPGTYILQFEASSERGRAAPNYSVVARSDVFLYSHWFAGLLVLWILPVLVFGLYLAFEKNRWMNSDHAG